MPSFFDIRLFCRYLILTSILVEIYGRDIIKNSLTMRLKCYVQIDKKLTDGSGASVKKKSRHSCLVIAKQSKSKDAFLFLKRKNNKEDIKYKINDNVITIFTKFINNGKSTIRLREPALDLHIQCDNTIELKSFLHVLKVILEKKGTWKITEVKSNKNLKFENLTSTSNKKVVVKNKASYPVLEGFSRTTEELHVSGLERKSFDRQMLRLQSLRTLNLSNNLIESIPAELGQVLPHLAVLNLSGNRLGDCTNHKKWQWLDGTSISKSLQLLDLSSNQIQLLPNQIGKLHNLVTLNIANNGLVRLPSIIGNLKKLKFLDMPINKIKFLPGTMQNLRLDTLNIYGNIFSYKNIPEISLSLDNDHIPTLTELASRVTINNRLFYDASTIPYTLTRYLDNSYFCVCGKSCFNIYYQKMKYADIREISLSITSTSTPSSILFHCVYCSNKCFQKFNKTSSR